MLVPAAALAAPSACGGSIDDWRDVDGTTKYKGAVTDSHGGEQGNRTVVLDGDTAWVPGHSDNLTATFTTEGPTIDWGTSHQYGSRTFQLSEPECAQGDTRVTSASFKQEEAGPGGAITMRGRLTRE